MGSRQEVQERYSWFSRAFFLAQPWLPSSVRCPQWDQSQLETATWKLWAESSFRRENHVVSQTWHPRPVHPT